MNLSIKKDKYLSFNIMILYVEENKDMAHQPVLLAVTIYLLHSHEIVEQLSPCPTLDRVLDT